MDNSAPVGCFDCLSDLSNGCQRFFDRNGTTGQTIRQRWPIDELKNEGAHTLRLFKAVDCGNVRVIERREELRLALEPAKYSLDFWEAHEGEVVSIGDARVVGPTTAGPIVLTLFCCRRCTSIVACISQVR